MSDESIVVNVVGEHVDEHLDKAQMAYDWLANNHDLIVGFAINIVTAIAVIIIGFMVARFASALVKKLLDKKNFDSTASIFVSNMVRYILMAFVVIAALSKLGLQTTSFVALIGAAGLAVGLALQGSLSNFASGILIIILRPFKAGEYIEAAGTAGTVEDVAIFATTVLSPDNKYIVIPNSAILSSNIVNYSRQDTRRIDLMIGVSYNADLAQTRDILEKVLLANPLVLKSPEIQVAVAELGDSSVNLVVRPWVKTSDYWPVRFELMEAIKNALDEANIEIPFPQMDVHVEK